MSGGASVGTIQTYDQDKIADLLGTGISNTAVAGAIGCDPSLITHMMSDPVFRERVITLRAKNLTAASKRDDKINDIEEALLDKLAEILPAFYKPRDILAAASVVNKMMRRGITATDTLGGQQPVVNIQIPVVVQQKLMISERGEIVEVNGQTMVTMPAQQLLRNLASTGSKEDADKYQKVAGFINGGGNGAGVENNHPDGGTLEINSR